MIKDGETKEQVGDGTLEGVYAGKYYLYSEIPIRESAPNMPSTELPDVSKTTGILLLWSHF